MRHVRMHVATPRGPLGHLFRLLSRLFPLLFFCLQMILLLHDFELTGPSLMLKSLLLPHPPAQRR